MTRLVLLGGGHAHVQVLDRLADERPPHVEVVLVSPFARQIYSGMLPGWIAGRYALEACALPLDLLAGRAGASFVQQACVRVDPAERWVECLDGRRIAFDWLSIDAGSATATDDLPGAAGHATPVRPIERFVKIVGRLLEDAQHGEPADTVIIGGGAAGVEIAFALSARFAALGRRDARVHVVGAAARPLDGLPRLLQWRAGMLMRERGIDWIGGRRVVAVAGGDVRLDDGTQLVARHVLQVTGAAVHPWLAGSGLATDREGFVKVTPALQSESHPRVFAAGDCAAYAHPRPKSGVFAVRAGPVLAANLLHAIAGEPLQEWRPQRRALYLVSTGSGEALAAWGPFAWWGGWVWRWKDRIDRRFVARFSVPREARAPACGT